MVPSPVSESLLLFVQQCQVAILAGTAGDYLDLVTSMWSCLDRFPRDSELMQSLVAVAVVARIAKGVLNRPVQLRLRLQGPLASRRRHANAALLFARQHYASRGLSQAQVAAHFGLSRGFLARALSAETGRHQSSAFRRHLNDIRLFAAVNRLAAEASPLLKLIASDVGFSHTAFMDRQFKYRFSICPRTFHGLLRMVPAGCFD